MDQVIQRLRERDPYDDEYNDCYYYGRNCYSNWYSWGRWVFLAGVILAFIALFAFCIYVARRRRSLTGYNGAPWMPFRPNRPGNSPQQFQTYPPQPYNPNGQTGEYYAPPIYTPSPQMTGNHFPPNQPLQPVSPYPPQQMGASDYPPSVQSPTQGVPHHSTGGSDYYMPPPGPPPTAHVGKI